MKGPVQPDRCLSRQGTVGHACNGRGTTYRSRFWEMPFSSLTQKLGSVGAVELDGCACDLLVALYNNGSQFE